MCAIVHSDSGKSVSSKPVLKRGDKNMGKYFGTDGLRGEANVTLTVEDAFKVGRFLGWYYGQRKKSDVCRIVIGKDTRRSSYMFEYSHPANNKVIIIRKYKLCFIVFEY